LVSPLDWGLGHATRCIPLIRQLLRLDFEVIIGAEGRAAALLAREFPQLELVAIPGYDILYPKGSGMALHMGMQLPRISRAIRGEHTFLDKMVKDRRLDAVISDNRFGLWSVKVPSIYMTHQLTIKAPPAMALTEFFLHRMHARYIRNFGECWIPDLEGKDGLSGDLAHKRPGPVPTFFIGPLSRFIAASPAAEKKYDLMFIISGPEPQRSIFEDITMQALSSGRHKALVLTGKPEQTKNQVHHESIEVQPHMDTSAMQAAMLSSDLVICRSGYSTIMDLATLGCRAVFVPTPGQTEQEYLARYHTEKGHYFHLRQDKFDLDRMISGSKGYEGIKITNDEHLLKERINELASRLDG